VNQWTRRSQWLRRVMQSLAIVGFKQLGLEETAAG